jgi:hypothetical protein
MDQQAATFTAGADKIGTIGTSGPSVVINVAVESGAGASSNGSTDKDAIAQRLGKTATSENQAGVGAASTLVLMRQHNGPTRGT